MLQRSVSNGRIEAASKKVVPPLRYSLYPCWVAIFNAISRYGSVNLNLKSTETADTPPNLITSTEGDVSILLTLNIVNEQ